MTAAAMTSVSTFNLIDEPWLPVAMLDGTSETLSLKELFARAHEARGLSEPSPLTYTAVMRFLLAILHRAHHGPDSPEAWAAIYDQQRFDAVPIDRYLEENRGRFDLFDPERPFAQALIAGAPGDEKPIAQLSFERVSGNNGTLYDHSIDAEPRPVSPGDAARLVLTAHQYGFSGSGIFSNTAMIAGYCLMLEGANLFQTLMFNLLQYDDTTPVGLTRTHDAPWWELDLAPAPLKEGNLPRGLTDLLTWQGRQILLVRDADGMVRHCWYRPGLPLRAGIVKEPFKRYMPGQDKGADEWFPRGFVENKALWRDSYAIFPATYVDNKAERTIPRPGIVNWIDEVRDYYDAMSRLDELEIQPTLVVTGVVNDKAAIRLWRMDRLPLQLDIVHDPERYGRVGDANILADRVREALRAAATTYATTVVGRLNRQPAPEDVTREIASLGFYERYWAALETGFQTFLHRLVEEDDPFVALDGWKMILRAAATNAFFNATNETNTDGYRMAAQAHGSRVLSSRLKKTLGENTD